MASICPRATTFHSIQSFHQRGIELGPDGHIIWGANYHVLLSISMSLAPISDYLDRRAGILDVLATLDNCLGKTLLNASHHNAATTYLILWVAA